MPVTSPETPPSAAALEPRLALIGLMQRLVAQGINRGASGNASVRHGRGVLITPSALLPEALTPETLVKVDMAGRFDNPLKPSSEWRIHRDIYLARPDINAVVHTHSTHAVTLACLREDLPPFHYMVAMAGGRDIRCSGYATFGTEALSHTAVAALEGRMACLLANHGMIACGQDLSQAETLAMEVEHLCEAYLRARSVGTPVLLSDADIDEVLARFGRYRRGELD
jgi:L-fuculose-phosphate aldolase